MPRYDDLEWDNEPEVEEKPPCPECASSFGPDRRTTAAMLAALDVERMLLDATIRERGGAEEIDRYDVKTVEDERNAVATGFQAWYLDLPVVLGALNVALASGVRDAGGSDAMRVVRKIEAYWRHLDSSEGCVPEVELVVRGRPWYPAALPLERVAALSPALRGRSKDDARRCLDAGRRGLGCGHGETEAAVAGNAADGPWLIHGVEVRVADRRFRSLLRAVLGHIGDRCPEDLDRIRRRVSRIERIPPGERPSRTLAYYGRSGDGAPDRLSGADGEPETEAWPIRVSRPVIEGPREKLVEVLGHELAHAASTPDDVKVRSGLGREWGSELAADHHAAKWGFGRLMASIRPQRDAAHHGPVPGDRVDVRFREHRMEWRVTDNRVLVREGPVQ